MTSRIVASDAEMPVVMRQMLRHGGRADRSTVVISNSARVHAGDDLGEGVGEQRHQGAQDHAQRDRRR